MRYKYAFSMGRKAISSRKKSEVKKLLLAGLITSDVAKKLKISTASVNNLKSNFKKEGIVFPDNRGKKTVSLNPIEVQTKEEGYTSDYSYTINGVKITFDQKPISLKIGKKGLVVEY